MLSSSHNQRLLLYIQSSKNFWGFVAGCERGSGPSGGSGIWIYNSEYW